MASHRSSSGGSGYYPLPPAFAEPAARLDPVHAAYVTGLFTAAN